jgi:hypothetical protein
MAEQQRSDAELARREAAVLVGLDPARPMCPADSLRVDLVSTLRLVIDAAGETVLEGGSADIGRLIAATESLIKLLPGRELPKPTSSRDDPRETMLRTYLQMRERGALAGEGYDGKVARIAELEAEVAALKARLAGKSEHSDIPAVVERVPASAGGNVVPLPRPAAPAAPTYDYNKERGWRDHVLPDGSISREPFGGGRKYWGPV